MISIHAPHARSDVYCSFLSSYNCISIHAPHARSDVGKIYWRHQKEISIHAPHARSDATTFCMDAVVSNFNPRSSCEERPPAGSRISCYKISIHAPHARSDDSIGSSAKRTTHFNPRSSCEERPPKFQCEDDAAQISIHAPHARSDLRQSSCSAPDIYFNPRSSCEERPEETSALAFSLSLFQSTLLMRGATEARNREYGKNLKISIHAPHARSDARTAKKRSGRMNFNPRSSCEERRREPSPPPD